MPVATVALAKIERRHLFSSSSIRVIAASIAWGECDSNPARNYDRSMIRERRDPIQPPTGTDIDAVVEAAPGNLAHLIRFLAETGCCQAEGVSLQWHNTDFARRTVTLLKTKTDRPRTISMNSPGDTVEGTLRKLVQHKGSPWVFWHAEGEPYRNVASRFAAPAARISAKFRCHDLRHAFAIRWLQAGAISTSSRPPSGAQLGQDDGAVSGPCGARFGAQ